jgi:hypothetical protein
MFKYMHHLRTVKLNVKEIYVKKKEKEKSDNTKYSF